MLFENKLHKPNWVLRLGAILFLKVFAPLQMGGATQEASSIATLSPFFCFFPSTSFCSTSFLSEDCTFTLLRYPLLFLFLRKSK